LSDFIVTSAQKPKLVDPSLFDCAGPCLVS